MKHFLPSSVMLTPFLVKHYDKTDETDEQDTELSEQPVVNHVQEQEKKKHNPTN